MVDLKDPVFTVYDSTNYDVEIPLGFVRRKLARLLNLLQDMTGTQIIDWSTVIILCTEDVPKQATEDGVNCSIFVWLMIELLMEDKLEIKHFPCSYKEGHAQRKEEALLQYEEVPGAKDPLPSGGMSLPNYEEVLRLSKTIFVVNNLI